MPLSITRKLSISSRLPLIRMAALVLQTAAITGRRLTPAENASTQRAFKMAIEELELCRTDGMEVGVD